MKVYWDSKTGIFEWQDRDDKISSFFLNRAKVF